MRKTTIFKATLALKTEPPAQVGQASPTWNTDQKEVTSQGRKEGLSRAQNSHRKVALIIIIIINIYLRSSQESQPMELERASQLHTNTAFPGLNGFYVTSRKPLQVFNLKSHQIKSLP